ncbi:MAG TPA: hypothetical protein VK030_06180, partial [Actinomycetales bacterium]|nr:hypothetical protein [Actinomycetales bacterium]
VLIQNVVIALATVFLLIAGVLFAGTTMAVGMLVHEISVLVVVANAVRLLRARPLPRGMAHGTSLGLPDESDSRAHPERASVPDVGAAAGSR